MIRIPEPRLHVETLAEAVTLDIPRPQPLNPDIITGIPSLRELTVEDVHEIRSYAGPLRIKPDSHRFARIEFVGGMISLNRIEISADQTEQGYLLRARKSGPALLLDLLRSTPTLVGHKEAISRVSIEVDGAVREVPQSSASFELVGGAATRIAMLPTDPKSQMSLPALRPMKLQFESVDFNAQGDPVRTPAIRSGSLSFVNGSQKWDLSVGSRLDLFGLNGIANLKTSADGIQLSFEGSAKVVRINDRGNMRDIKPNLVDWVSSDPAVKLLWTSVVFLSGLVLSSVRLFRRSGEAVSTPDH